MPKFLVRLSATAVVSTSVEVDVEDVADADEKAMEIAKSGNAIWSYDGVYDETIQVELVKTA